MEFDDLFDTDGEMDIPTMRGSANLDVQDYQDIFGTSSILDDDLEEDVPSTPGRRPGAAPATDIEGTEEFDMLRVPGGMAAPGMKQTTYGDSPWGPGSDSGYRPYSQQRTDMELRALGDDDAHPTREPQPMPKDDMMMEPEVIDAEPVQQAVSWDDEWHGMRNRQPSNAEIDPMTIYDRTSYEYDSSSQDTIGNGIFSMEEGATWRPRDGMFAHQYALPAYIGEEDELGVQQSEMWDSTAEEWRVTQPSASGVALARRVRRMKRPFRGGGQVPQMRPEVTGPRSHIEAFGRKAAKCVLLEAQAHKPQSRSGFLQAALEALGPGLTARCQKAADTLVRMGYAPQVALEDAIAHCVMHAAVKDLTQKKGGRSTFLPRLDQMAKRVSRQRRTMQSAATEHLQPLTENGNALRKDLGSLYRSPAARGMGLVAEDPAAPTGNGDKKMGTATKFAIAGGVGLGAYLLFANRKSIVKNLKKMMG